MYLDILWVGGPNPTELRRLGKHRHLPWCDWVLEYSSRKTLQSPSPALNCRLMLGAVGGGHQTLSSGDLGSGVQVASCSCMKWQVLGQIRHISIEGRSTSPLSDQMGSWRPNLAIDPFSWF